MTRKEKIKGVLLLAFCVYVIVFVSVYLLRLVFIRQAFLSEEIVLVPALIFLVGFAFATFIKLEDSADGFC